MMTQKAISARIRHETLWRIEQEAMLGHYNRNQMLNRGADLFIDLLDVRRELASCPDLKVRRKILRGFLIRSIPELTGSEI